MRKKENDELIELFRSSLSNAELTPREGFWEKIQNDIPDTIVKRRHLNLYRTAAAASVLLILGAASAAFLYFTPKNNAIKSIIAKSATPVGKPASFKITGSEAKGFKILVSKVDSRHSSSVKSGRISTKQSSIRPETNQVDENDSTITVTVRMRVHIEGDYANNNNDNNAIWQVGGFGYPSKNTSSSDNEVNKYLANNTSKNKDSWAIKAALNIATPATGKFSVPIGGSLTIEKKLNNWLALESGIQYTNMHSDDQTLQYLSIPIKANFILAKSSKVDLYATAGGTADKCISASHDSANEGIQFTSIAGLGLRYHLNNKISFYAEPTLTHYINNNAKYTSYRTEQKNAFNLQGGLCMTF